MDTGTLVTIGVIVLAVVVLMRILRAAGMGRSRPKMRPLSPSARMRYMNQWDEIETRFIDAPEEAVRQAETVVMSVLHERGHPLSDRDLPAEVKRAHKHAYGTRDRTEGMRKAMLHYRAIMEKMIGHEPTELEREEEQRRLREMA
jgi:hypothetical protein